MADTREVLHWASMTAVVNELKTPSRFVRDLLFSDNQPKATEVLEIGVLIGDRVVAPFVKKGAQAVEVDSFQERIYNVEAPNIRIKTKLEAKELMFERRVGHVIFEDQAGILNAAQQHIARKSLRLVQMVDEAEEYMACMALRGAVSYEVDGEEAFSITFPRSSSHNVTLMTFWDQMGSLPEEDERAFDKLVQDDTSLTITHAILGAEATDAFLQSESVQALLDNRRIDAGNLQMQARQQQNGALFLGNFRGIPHWSYTRSTLIPSAPNLGATTSFDLIRPKYVEYVVADAAAENVMYYGAIGDIDALEGGTWVGRRFSKSWKTPDPSQMWQLLHSRPLPVMRRPDSTLSAKVVSG